MLRTDIPDPIPMPGRGSTRGQVEKPCGGRPLRRAIGGLGRRKHGTGHGELTATPATEALKPATDRVALLAQCRCGGAAGVAVAGLGFCSDYGINFVG